MIKHYKQLNMTYKKENACATLIVVVATLSANNQLQMLGTWYQILSISCTPENVFVTYVENIS